MITDRNIDPGANIDAGKIAFPYILSGKHTDGSLPRVFWVAKGGADSLSSRQGGRDEPFLTLSGTNGAFRPMVDGRGDRLALGPGTWRENLDLGSSTGTTGSAGRMNKRDVGLYGTGGAHTGRTQIVGDGTTAGPTIRVRDGYLRGFVLANLEVGAVTTADADRAVPGIDLETNDAAALTATSSDEWAKLINVHVFSGGTTGTAGLILTGATMVAGYDLVFSNWIIGILLRGSLVNEPDNCRFFRTEFADNLTADIGATGSHAMGSWPSSWAFSGLNGANIRWYDSIHADVGGTPVTNYINWGGGTGVGTLTNCGTYRAHFGRDVADGTLVQVPAGFTVTGESAGGAENFVGS